MRNFIDFVQGRVAIKQHEEGLRYGPEIMKVFIEALKKNNISVASLINPDPVTMEDYMRASDNLVNNYLYYSISKRLLMVVSIEELDKVLLDDEKAYLDDFFLMEKKPQLSIPLTLHLVGDDTDK